MTIELRHLAPETIDDIRSAENSVPLIAGDHLTEAGMAYLTSQDEVTCVNSPEDLAALAQTLRVRPDWHEPDEQEVDVRIRGNHLDNAMGSTMRDIGDDNEAGEYNIVITREGRDVAVVNLATLLSWGAELGRAEGRRTR